MLSIRFTETASQDCALLIEDFSEKALKKQNLEPDQIKLINRYFTAGKSVIHLPEVEEDSDLYCVKLEKGKEDYLTLENARKSGFALFNEINALKVEEITLLSENSNPSIILAFAEGLALSAYQFNKYKSKPKNNLLAIINIMHKAVTAADCKELNSIIEAVTHAKDLVNEPFLSLGAEDLSDQIKKLGKESGFKVEVLGLGEIEDLEMGGILAVNQGSVEDPTFNILEYKPKGAVNKHPLVLVGKGVVYDTGGLSLKTPSVNMETMKCDMGGAAAVVGIFHLIAKLKLPVYIVGLIPSTDNQLSATSVTPGDVITMMDGTTVEVLNTDAEGRLILADALTYAKRYNPALVFDFATLTGAAQRAIGSQASVYMGITDQIIKEEIEASAYATFERLVEFPLWDDYKDLLKSDIADLKNVSGGVNSGAITAGKFLEHFTDYPWIHFDIAGTAFNSAQDSYRSKNATGFMVRSMYYYIKNYFIPSIKLEEPIVIKKGKK